MWRIAFTAFAKTTFFCKHRIVETNKGQTEENNVIIWYFHSSRETQRTNLELIKPGKNQPTFSKYNFELTF